MAGYEGTEVGSHGLFHPPRLGPLFEVSDSAAHYFDIVEDKYTRSEVTRLLGLAVGLFFLRRSLIDAGDEVTDSDWTNLGGSFLGIGIMALGDIEYRSARAALSTSIWWYNRSLTNADQGDPRERR